MLKRILIANRGEIAVRVIRACREMGIESVAIYSKVDQEALHVKLADISICIGEQSLSETYLDMHRIISTAKTLQCDGIHPGYGFLSENPKFARICEKSNIKFIGPSAEIIENMGNKSMAREMMKKAKVKIVPGTKDISTVEEGIKAAERIGFPVLIKAAAGGGGKGMRVAENIESFKKAYNTAKSEARNAFNDDRVYLEKFIENPRHVEIQILADEHGNVIHLGERDCSVQRNHQKIIEESPSMAIDSNTRIAMGKEAVKAAKFIGYQNAGTVEFLVDKHQNYYFIEMNTRIQVEHPVTEMLTGIDLIKYQINIANGKALDIKQNDVTFNGHVIECRINAEDPSRNFMPSPGKLNIIHLPGGYGVRFDSYIYDGYKILPLFDSLLGKIIVKGQSRKEAIMKMKSALGEMTIENVPLNISFLYEIMCDKNFCNSDYDTSYIELFLNEAGDLSDR